MPTFSYQVVSQQGKQNKGNIEADTRQAAMDALRGSGFTIISVDEVGALNKDVQLKIFEKRPTPRDLAVFCRQFVAILDAGVPAVQALEMLAEQTENQMLASALADCKTTIGEGETLADAMREHKKVFPDMLVTLVAAGEASGTITTSFARMADQFEKTAALQETIKKATIYPTFLVCLMVGMITVMLTFVVPRFMGVFDSIGGKMPALTQFTLGLALFMQHRWYIVIGAIILIVFGIKKYKQTPGGQRFFGKLAIHSRIRGKLVIKTASARMARTLGTLLAAGLPLVDAVGIAAETMDNYFFKDALEQAKNAVALGQPLSGELKRSNIFPPLVYHMVGIGEETGDIEGMLDKLAQYYEEEVQSETERLMALIEPIIIVIMAVVVGLMIISIVLPMMSMYDSVSNM